MSDQAAVTRVNTLSVGGVGWALVIDGWMCFPTDNVSLLSRGCCFPSSHSVTTLTVKTAHVSRPMKMDDSLSGGYWGMQRRRAEAGRASRRENAKKRERQRPSRGGGGEPAEEKIQTERGRESKERLMGEGKREWENKVRRQNKERKRWRRLGHILRRFLCRLSLQHGVLPVWVCWPWSKTKEWRICCDRLPVDGHQNTSSVSKKHIVLKVYKTQILKI